MSTYQQENQDSNVPETTQMSPKKILVMAVVGVALVVCIVGGVAHLMVRDTGAGKSGTETGSGNSTAPPVTDNSITPTDGSIVPPGTGGSIIIPAGDQTDSRVVPDASQDPSDDDADDQGDLFSDVHTDDEANAEDDEDTKEDDNKFEKEEVKKSSGWFFDWLGFRGSAGSTTKQTESSSKPKRLFI